MIRKRLLLAMPDGKPLRVYAPLLLIALSWWGVAAARSSLVMRNLESEGMPMLYFAPRNTQKIPSVLIAHGYAGSKQLMLGYATLVKQPEVDSLRLALLGHSMGSGAVMAASLQDVNRFAATVAVSPTGAV